MHEKRLNALEFRNLHGQIRWIDCVQRDKCKLVSRAGRVCTSKRTNASRWSPVVHLHRKYFTRNLESSTIGFELANIAGWVCLSTSSFRTRSCWLVGNSPQMYAVAKQDFLV